MKEYFKYRLKFNQKICKTTFPARYAVGGEAGGLEQAHKQKLEKIMKGKT
ncbi:MAG: hypothetical protein KJ666_01040 [Bacteroidetes bacterium]|nr:hypothetical protein [Bacteroidota bacterium]MBU2585382.1 hypothetical protein [Bacteroidota bacterium]